MIGHVSLVARETGHVSFSAGFSCASLVNVHSS